MMEIKRPQSKQPIPPHAREVFKGKTFSIYQWEQELYDGKKAIFEKVKRPDTVGIIPITPEGKIIICEQEQPGIAPFIGGFGGAIDAGENPLDAAKRELLEETGLTAREFFLWDAIQPMERTEWAIYTFIAKGVQKVQEQNLEPGEKITVKEVTFDEFLEIVKKENFRDMEVALKILRIIQSPEKLGKLKKIFGVV